MHMGIIESNDSSKTSFPAVLRKLPFHPLIFALTLSLINSNIFFSNRPTTASSPEYISLSFLCINPIKV